MDTALRDMSRIEKRSALKKPATNGTNYQREGKGMPRQSSIVSFAALFAIALINDGVALGAASAVPDNIRLTWSESPKTTQTIGWRTDTTVTTGKVEYAGPDNITLTAAAPAPETLATNVGGINLFSLTLRGLKPGTAHKYRVGDGKNWSPYYTFRTEKAAEDKFEFLVFGDSHEKKPVYNVWRQTVNQAYKQNPSVSFVMNVGDLIYSGKDYEQWQAWFAACQDVIASIPEMPAIGDHEPRGVTSKDEWQRPEYFVKLFRVPQNGPEQFKGEVYSFDYGSAHIVVLNSSFHYEFSDPAARKAMIDAEVAWLDADLAATRKPWKIAVYHDATYNISPDRSGTLTKMHFGPIIDKHHVDVVFNAHDHAMARSYFIKDGNFVASAAEGTVYFVSGRTGDNAKDSLSRKIWHPFFHDPQAQSCYLAVTVGRDELVIRTRLQDGTVVDTFKINRTRPEESTPAVPFGAYRSPRFAAFGFLLPFGKAPEQNKSGEWFVDVTALAAFLSGKFDPGTRLLSYDKDQVKLQFSEDMFLEKSREMVSLAGLTKLGFTCRYHAGMNMVMVERWKD